EDHFAGRTPPIGVCWASLVTSNASWMLHLWAMGHAVVSLVRMSGFRIPRNTVSPLYSRTLADFWNSNYFYFKELLVDFFFFPTFLRCCGGRPRLRLAVATFCAAGAGNLAYHVIRRIDVVAQVGWLGAASAFSCYAVYALALSGGLVVSQ